MTGSTSGSFGGPNLGDRDVWLAKFEPSGNQLWIQQFGTSQRDLVSGLAFDGSGGLWLGGLTQGSFAGTNPNPGTFDIVIARFQSSCYSDCDGDGVLSIDDFICFQTLFALGC